MSTRRYDPLRQRVDHQQLSCRHARRRTVRLGRPRRVRRDPKRSPPWVHTPRAGSGLAARRRATGTTCALDGRRCASGARGARRGLLAPSGSDARVGGRLVSGSDRTVARSTSSSVHSADVVQREACAGLHPQRRDGARLRRGRWCRRRPVVAPGDREQADQGDDDPEQHARAGGTRARARGGGRRCRGRRGARRSGPRSAGAARTGPRLSTSSGSSRSTTTRSSSAPRVRMVERVATRPRPTGPAGPERVSAPNRVSATPPQEIRMSEPVIVATARSPIGRANKGSLVDVRPDDLAATIVRAALDRVPGARPHRGRGPDARAVPSRRGSRATTSARVVAIQAGTRRGARA